MKSSIIKTNIKRFFSSKLLVLSMLAFIVISVGYIISEFNKDISFNDTLFPYIFALWTTNKISVYSFACFTFISFEFASKLYSSKLHETMLCTPKQLKPFCISNICVLTLWNVFYCLVLLVYNCYAFLSLHEFDKVYLIHIFINIAVNFFLVNTFAICFGQAVTFFKKKIYSYLFILAFMIAVSPIGNELTYTVFMITESFFNPYKIYNFFDIFTPNLDFTPTFAMGFSVLPYRIYLLLFWIFLMIAITAFFTKRKKLDLKPIAALTISIIMLISFLLPDSRVVLSDDPDGEAYADQFYYYDLSDELIEYEKADFCIEKYDMDLKINRKLNATVTMYPDIERSSYSFTLYHGYTVKSVTDQNHKKLKFTRDGDYITINNCDGVTAITIQYSGSGKGFYSNYQGIYLPGDFPYYPVAGKQQVFNDLCYIPVLSENTPYFEISIQSNLKIYSNLNSANESVFSGETKVPCIFAGLFYREREYKGSKIVYPYLCAEYDDHFELLAEMVSVDENDNKLIILEPNTNVSWDSVREYENIVLW